MVGGGGTFVDEVDGGIRIVAHGYIWYISAVHSCSVEYTDDFTDSIGYGGPGDFFFASTF